MAISTYLERRMARQVGGSDITRLAGQYKKDIDALSGQYQTQLDKYKTDVAAKMAPYEAQMSQYKQTVEPQYQSALESYNAKLAEYQRQLADIAANPVTERVERAVVGRTWYGKKKYGNVYYYDPKPIPTFTETPPNLPDMPVAPKVEAFDTKELDVKRGQLQEGYQREIAERKSSRASAVQRRTRTMLSGVSQ